MAKSSAKSAPRSPMTATAVSRIQSATAKANGGQVAAGSFVARAQSVVARNATTGNTNGSGGNA